VSVLANYSKLTSLHLKLQQGDRGTDSRLTASRHSTAGARLQKLESLKIHLGTTYSQINLNQQAKH